MQYARISQKLSYSFHSSSEVICRLIPFRVYIACMKKERMWVCVCVRRRLVQHLPPPPKCASCTVFIVVQYLHQTSSIFCGKSASLSFLWRIICTHSHIMYVMHISWDMWELLWIYKCVVQIYFVPAQMRCTFPKTIYFSMVWGAKHTHALHIPQNTPKNRTWNGLLLCFCLRMVFIFEGGVGRCRLE